MKMPKETQDAVNWALQQQYEIEEGIFINVTHDLPFTIVDKVREYFNTQQINYTSFGFSDLLPHLK